MAEIRILMFGDAVGEAGVGCLQKQIPLLKRKYQAAAVIVNGENSAKGNGITQKSAEQLFACGTDVITTGNHCFRRKCPQIFENPRILRPANYPEGAPGKGVCTLDCGAYSVAVVNLMGTVFMEPLDNPYAVIDSLLPEIGTKNIILDFHAEATAEKRALGWYLAGKVSAVIGTHTHVQTADEEILAQHTGYLTDVGMNGAADSVLGVKKEQAIQKQRLHLPVQFTEAPPPCIVNAVCLTLNTATGACTSIERIFLREDTTKFTP